jgi:hypothetical protein
MELYDIHRDLRDGACIEDDGKFGRSAVRSISD